MPKKKSKLEYLTISDSQGSCGLFLKSCKAFESLERLNPTSDQKRKLLSHDWSSGGTRGIIYLKGVTRRSLPLMVPLIKDFSFYIFIFRSTAIEMTAYNVMSLTLSDRYC